MFNIMWRVWRGKFSEELIRMNKMNIGPLRRCCQTDIEQKKGHKIKEKRA